MKKYAIEIKWGVIFAIMGLVWMFIERSVGLHDDLIAHHATYTNLIAIPAIAIYVFALLEKRNVYYHGKMTYWQGFKTGLLITLVVTILTPLTQWITLSIITPQYFENVIAYAVENGKMTQQEANDYFNLKSYMIQSILGAPIMGIVTSGIVAAFTMKK
ncbi:DUF4199 domain-containing protein [uncultured Cyclobacterium sp.]|uniref:DUF4199 domain-containing protein n=1 Tax=uncultured Cyclobacterium sp. TaxID=453820 RepID=UPI0030EFA4DF|tara:strand:+ start:30474 stop:30950 length:477 start_codon:yes stop_codon:yes gene_type:complete